jgi:hypothetical protein
MDYSYTKEAKNVIKNDFDNKNIVFIGEYLSHDGYDRFGPKSNLWDLFIIEDNGTNFIFYEYYWENWFTEYQSHGYDFEKKKNLENCTFSELEKIIKRMDGNTDVKLKDLVKSLYTSIKMSRNLSK